jgi:hypothetical protein
LHQPGPDERSALCHNHLCPHYSGFLSASIASCAL